MKKFPNRFFLGALVGVLFVAPAFAFAQYEYKSEKITSFHEEAHINTDGTVNVTETIAYYFPSQKHGIFRNIPVKYSTSIGKISTHVSNISVVDEKNNPYKFTTSYSGNDLTIKIGDPNTYVNADKTYVISYTIAKTIGYFKTYDEWYWNVTGNGWDVPIESVDAVYYLPQTISGKDVQASCYEGAQGSTEICGTSLQKEDTPVDVVAFKSARPLNPHEGMTAAVGFPKGVVVEPTQSQKILDLLVNNGIIVLPIIVLIVMFFVWLNKGKDPKGRGTIVPEYDAPDNLTPAEMSMVLHQSVRNKDISAEIIYLATKGYIKITRVETKKLIFTSTDYSLERLKNPDDLPNQFDRTLLDGLFSLSSPTVLVSDLKKSFYKTAATFKKEVTQSVVAKGYYPKDPGKVIGTYIGFGVIAFILFWILGAAGVLNGLMVISLITSGIIIVIFALFMPKVTELGAVTRERIKGLQMYIGVAEEARINFHNAPAKNPQLFETLLPYAMLFAMEKQWAKQFEGIYTTPPSWYNDPHGGMFNAVIFSQNLSSFSSAASSITSAPSGGSGSGGGGFSGGGFGGGGGGSW